MPNDILIVDDCRLTAKILGRVMKEMGFEVHTAQSGEEAIDFLSKNATPSLLFVDWVMPGLSGIEFIAWLRAQDTTKSVPVLMVTAERDLSKIAEAIQSGANEYIMKPFSPEIIQEKLRLLGIEVGV
jgi:two-component system chemotaxis response regulator CheY